MSKLLEQGEDVNQLAKVGHYGTALIAAILKDLGWNMEVVSEVLAREADINLLGTTGTYRTALITAIFIGRIVIMSKLLGQEAEVNLEVLFYLTFHIEQRASSGS